MSQEIINAYQLLNELDDKLSRNGFPSSNVYLFCRQFENEKLDSKELNNDPVNQIVMMISSTVSSMVGAEDEVPIQKVLENFEVYKAAMTFQYSLPLSTELVTQIRGLIEELKVEDLPAFRDQTLQALDDIF